MEPVVQIGRELSSSTSSGCGAEELKMATLGDRTSLSIGGSKKLTEAVFPAFFSGGIGTPLGSLSVPMISVTDW